MSRGFASNYRVVLLATGLFACFVAVGVRLVHLHVIDRENLVRNIAKTRRTDVRETARRGEIVDRNGRTLATSRPLIVLAVDPMSARPEDDAKLPRLAELLGLPLPEVQEKFHTKFRTVRVAVKNPAADAAAEAGRSLQLRIDLPVMGTPAREETGGGDALADLAFGQALADANATPASPPAPAAEEPEGEDEAAGGAAEQLRAIRYVKLSENVSEATYDQIAKLKIKGLCPPERRFARVYPEGELAAHLIGYANKKNVGGAGVEAFAEFYLRGQDGWREGEKDGRRRELAQFQTRSIPRADGYTVVMSIDARVQDIVEQELETIARTYEPLKATIIVSDPRTGFILGMGNHPTYNPNEYNRVPLDQMARMKNIAVTDSYEPGSVFKIVAAAAALEERVVGVDTRFDCSITHISFPWRKRGVVDVKLPGEDHRFDHPISVAEIIAKSSNRGAAQLALRLGDERFDAYARAFGFGERLGFPVGGEVGGIFKPRTEWLPIDFTRIPMGHTIASTALQMHQAMAVIASGGYLLRPQIIREIRDTSNAVVYQYGRTEIRRVISPETAHTMASLLQRVATKDGTAPKAAIKLNGIDFEVAGKTGTAQKYVKQVRPDGRVRFVPSTKHHVVSFVGFFPASRPQVAISVIVDEADQRCPNGEAYGSSVAAPVFRSIGEKLIPILSITPPKQPAPIDMVAAIEGGRR